MDYLVVLVPGFDRTLGMKVESLRLHNTKLTNMNFLLPSYHQHARLNVSPYKMVVLVRYIHLGFPKPYRWYYGRIHTG